MIGLPLPLDGQSVGVFVYWEQGLTKKDKRRFEPVAGLLARAVLAGEAENSRQRALESIRQVLTRLQKDIPSVSNLREILEAIQAAGFVRVRVLVYREADDKLVGLTAVGTKDDGAFPGTLISVSGNPYNSHIRALAVNFGDMTAHVYPSANTRFGPDPDGVAVGKSEKCIWAEVPLMVHGRFYGSIAADNEGTDREISEDGRDALTLFGALAAQVIANDELMRKRDQDAQRERLEKDLSTLRTAIHLADGLASLPTTEKTARLVWSQTQQLARLLTKAGSTQSLKSRLAEFEPLCLRKMAKELTDAFEEAFKDHRWKIELPSDGCWVKGNSTYLRVAFGNLIDNAVRYSPKSRVIELGLVKTPDSFLFSVGDYAGGVPADLLPDPIERSRGLGLRITKEIVEAHGGRLEYAAVQAGSRFIIVLPAFSIT
jgi:K+-sensing histidine kinase KdpD